MLLVMMLAFFRADPPINSTSNSTSNSGPFGSLPSPNSSKSTANGGPPKKPRMVLQQPDKVMRIHDYYMHKLQVKT